MIYNNYGIYISIVFALACIAIFFFNFKPKFIFPTKYFDQNKYILFKIVNLLLVLSILILPLDLQFVSDKKIITQKILPVQIIFDVSISMAADDIKPSRYDAAKTALLKLMTTLEGYNISLIAFSGIPLIYIPFSTTTEATIAKFQDTNLSDFPPTEDFVGTAIGDALLLGIRNLDKIRLQDPDYPWIIILITDGDSNKWYNPLQVLSIIQKKKVPVFALGVGESDYLIGYDKRWSPVQTSINIPLLQEVTRQTWGEFYRVLQESNFDEFFSYLKDVIKAQEKQKIENQYLVLNQYLLVIMGICVVFLLYAKFKQFRVPTIKSGQTRA